MKNRTCLLLILGLFCLFRTLTVAGPAESSVHIARLTQEAPGLHNYPGAKGMVWYRDLDYKLAADGRMERTSTWVILASRGLDEKWRNWELPSGKGSSVEVIESSLYDPGTSSMLAPVIPQKQDMGDHSIISIRFPDIQDEYLILLSYKEVMDKGLRLDDLVPLNMDLPVWENRIRVTVPEGSELYYTSEGIDPPVIKTGSSATSSYEWTSFNMSSAGKPSLAIRAVPFLSFSLRKGTEAFARDIQSFSSVSIPEPPARVDSFINESNRINGGSRIIDYVEKAPLLQGFMDQYVRTSIPPEGPWSSFEKVLILSQWLRKAGWSSDIHWVTMQEIMDDTPYTEGFITMPLLEIAPPGGGTVFYQLGGGYTGSEVPPQLWGSSVYHLEDGQLVKRSLPVGKASDHRLNISWDLDLSEDGNLAGSVRFLVRNGWKALLLDNTEFSESAVEKMFSDLGIPGYNVAELEISPIKYGASVKVPVSFNSAIISGNNTLLRFPAVSLEPLEELGKIQPEYDLRFPFVVEHDFQISYPDGYEVVAPPATTDRDFGKISLKENFFSNKRKKKFTGSIKIVVNTEVIDSTLHRPILEALRGWMLWMDKTIPLHKK